MARHTRRNFLKRSASVAGATALAPLATAGAEAASPKQMVICRWENTPAPTADLKTVAEKLTREAIGALGGMDKFVSEGDVVWIKPNMAWNRTPEQAANTNPDVVATLIKLCFDAGAKTVKVGDRTCHEAKQSYPTSGIEAAAKEAGAEVIYLDDSRYRDVEIGGEQLKTWPVYPEIVESDLVINVPVVKHHTLATATMCMKNYMGVINNRPIIHQNFAVCLTDLTRFMAPQISVLDAVRIMTGHGPVGGSLDDVELKLTLAAGTDVIALDSWGAGVLGKTIEELPFITKGASEGLGTTDYKSISKEIAVS